MGGLYGQVLSTFAAFVIGCAVGTTAMKYICSDSEPARVYAEILKIGHVDEGKRYARNELSAFFNDELEQCSADLNKLYQKSAKNPSEYSELKIPIERQELTCEALESFHSRFLDYSSSKLEQEMTDFEQRSDYLLKSIGVE